MYNVVSIGTISTATLLYNMFLVGPRGAKGTTHTRHPLEPICLYLNSMNKSVLFVSILAPQSCPNIFVQEVQHKILLLCCWAFTRQLTHFLRALMPYNSPLDSLSCDRTGGLLLKANILICVHSHPWSPTHMTWFLFLCSNINVTILFLEGGIYNHSPTFSLYM